MEGDDPRGRLELNYASKLRAGWVPAVMFEPPARPPTSQLKVPGLDS